MGLRGGSGRLPSKFEEQYHCYSVAYADKAHLEGGDKILLPPSAFDTLAHLNVDYPMLFCLQSNPPTTSSNKSTSTTTSQTARKTHCGVLEFTSEEGSCFIPFWMMQNLFIEEGSLLTITNISLPKATYVKLQPQHVDFLDITNPRAVLEHSLRNFSCVTKGDVICIPYNERNYHFELKEVKPANAACIIETDCNVDFDPPVGYDEDGRKIGEQSQQSEDQNFGEMDQGGGFSSKGKGHPEELVKVAGKDGKIDGDLVTTTASSSVAESTGTQIVNGAIVRPSSPIFSSSDNDNNFELDNTTKKNNNNSEVSTMAPRTGETGVQQNSAFPEKAPNVDYWALQCGNGLGARLDGKNVNDKIVKSNGEVIDFCKIRAEAATQRLLAAAKANNNNGVTGEGRTLNGKLDTFTKDGNTPSSKKDNTAAEVAAAKTSTVRKSRVGNKYSKLKKDGGFAFGGPSNRLG